MIRPNWSVTNRFIGSSQKFSLVEAFQLQKITTNLHILAQLNIQFRDDRYVKLKTYISETDFR
jgi:hypothetical protein